MPQGRAGQTAPAPTPTTPTPPADPGLSRQVQCLAAQDGLRGAEAAVDALQGQISNLQQQRTQIASRLRDRGDPAAVGPDLDGLNARIALLDKQLIDLYTQKAVADANVVRANAVPCAVPPPVPRAPRTGPPEEAFVLGGFFIVLVLFPLTIAYSRRIWRRSAKVIMGIPAELSERLNRLEESIDSVAIEVERVGEGQRFVTNLFMEGGQQMLGPGAMNTLEIKERERVEAEQRR
jgi:hypothetical protein